VSHESLRDATPNEAYSVVKYFIDHFRVFGSPTYSYIPFDRRTNMKLLEKYMLVGYSDESKAFRIFLPV
jgi:hypothetical protein